MAAHATTAPGTVAPAQDAESASFPLGYTAGYRAAVDALSVMLCDPHTGAGDALRRATAHQSCLSTWQERDDGSTPPSFHHLRPTVSDPARSGRAFAAGYQEGWGAALDHFRLLVARHHTPRFTALDVLRDHLSDALLPWLHTPRTDQTPPHLHPPRLVRGDEFPRTR